MKKNLLLAILSGFLLALSWPTYGFTALIFIAFVPLLLAEQNIRKNYTQTKRKVFIISYLSFLIWNIITTWWIWHSTKGGAVFAILANTLLMTITFLLYHVVAKRLPQKIAFIFLITIWLSFEKFHLTWDVSWPWLNLGNVFSGKITWVQWYEYTGAFGGSLWVLFINILLFSFIKSYFELKNRKNLAKGVGISVLCFAVPVLVSYFMYINYKEKENPIDVIVLQPNIDPYFEKYQISNQDIAQLLVNLSEKSLDEKVNFIITPETVFADNVKFENLQNSWELSILRSMVLKFPNLNVVGGIAMIDFFKEKSKITEQSNYLERADIWYNDYNSAFLLNRNDSIPLYHKSKLVVGVENFPYQSILKPILGETLIDLGGTVALKTTQEERSVFFGEKTEGKAAPIICYESIYGEFVTDYIKNGANFLAILTNDAWWKNTQGHKQLLSYAQLRAIETRRSIARSANTGISAFINQRGEITDSLAYEKQGSLRSTINLNDKITFYVKMGDYLARISLFLSLFIFLYAMARKRD
ncbi:apolipoprotein N-acyltransferase [Capnocytophaga stomatis]|uniref:apolipoprotein N-acyltransferase n=1 Tax=Capnocytophaga stomatis TaxID=1848904 RepID=UPI00194E3AED|nr:apolipoprotein N-acyltransferase [Capnocytophaga stomatis]GIJ96349.1 apolipoprotein N-acyltransferase [Capnocytophaga stomatis]